jgi:hypothetical protein
MKPQPMLLERGADGHIRRATPLQEVNFMRAHRVKWMQQIAQNETIIEAIKKGVSAEVIAATHGVGISTVDKWVDMVSSRRV